jgi:ribosomal-protein-alanine N-acetyltransferase
MVLFDWLSETTGPAIEGRDVLLRPPVIADHLAWSALRERSRDYLQIWEPTWPEDDLTRAAFRRRLTIYEREMEAGTAWPLFVYRRGSGELVGAMTLSNIRRGVADTGTLGYWIGQPYAGQGLATDAARAICRFAFQTLGLHRVEAACLPANDASRRVLEKTGFRLEGRARAYLKINGAWADHLLFGLLSDEARPDA